MIQQIFTIDTGPDCDATNTDFILDQTVIPDTGPDCDTADIYH